MGFINRKKSGRLFDGSKLNVDGQGIYTVKRGGGLTIIKKIKEELGVPVDRLITPTPSKPPVTPSNTPTQTLSPTPTPTITPTNTNTPTNTLTITPTNTPTPSPSPIPMCYGFSSTTTNSIYTACTLNNVMVGSTYTGDILVSAGTIDSVNFQYGTGFIGTATRSLDIQSDNKIIIGGQFTSYSGNSSSPVNKQIIRLNSGGTLDTTFNYLGTTYAGGIWDLIIQPDGKIVVGWSNSVINSLLLQRVTSTGSFDTSFNFNNGGTIVKILLNNDGSMYVGGTFTQPRSKLLKLTSGLILDTSFNTSSGFSTGAPLGMSVYDIATQSNGTVIAIGDFTAYGVSTRNRIVALTTGGTIDSSFNYVSGFNDRARCILMLNDNSMIIGGEFTTYNSTLYRGLIKLASDGTIDTSLNIGTGFLGGAVESILKDSDGNLIILGGFTSYNGQNYSGIVKIDLSGNTINSFDVGNGFSGYTNAFNKVQKGKITVNNKIIPVGTFKTYDNCPASYITQINNSATTITDTFKVISSTTCSSCCPYTAINMT